MPEPVRHRGLRSPIQYNAGRWLIASAAALQLLLPQAAQAALLDSTPLPSLPGAVILLLVVLTGLLTLCFLRSRSAERKCSVLFNTAIEGIFQTLPGGRFLFANRAMAEILGYDSPMEMVTTLIDFDHQLYVHSVDRERLLQILGEYNEARDFECELHKRDGSVIWGSINARLVRNRQGNPLRIEGFLTNISARKKAETMLRHQSLYDTLTGLPNRNLLTDRIGRAIERSRRRGDYYYALLFVDIDRLKVLNDSYGHAFGDLVLGEVTLRLKACVRELDTVARFGSDEFVVLLEEIDTAREAVRVVKRVHSSLRDPMELAGQTVQISVSTGVVLKTASYDIPDDILRNADIAMHRAKDMGPDHFKVFTPRLHDEAVQAMTMENDIDSALANGEFFLVYQPIVSNSGKIGGFEALARWQHPEHGLIMPTEFISIAEETGRIDALGMWVLREACTTLAAWRELSKDNHGLTLAVNMSGRQFARKSIVKDIKMLLDEAGLPASALRIELTESVLMADAESTVRRLHKLRALGVTISIDDFGTGYSSMSYLQRFPLDNLKIDLSFVQGLEDKPESVAIVRAIISLAHSLGLNVVAEGVEKVAQREVLAELGCESYQGYLFSRPISRKDAEKLMADARQSAALAAFIQSSEVK